LRNLDFDVFDIFFALCVVNYDRKSHPFTGIKFIFLQDKLRGKLFLSNTQKATYLLPYLSRGVAQNGGDELGFIYSNGDLETID
jgi:hypothetical protein